MKIGIGIDTGGTYTDVVIYNFNEKRILRSAKALTTKEDLSIGIGKALDALPIELLKKAEIASLSTTLATNACVEDRAGRAKLIFIDIYKKIVAYVGKSYGLPDLDEIFFLDVQKNENEEVAPEPNWDSFMLDIEDWLKDAEAIGIVEVNALKNNAELEKKTKNLLVGKYDIPIICGHELFSDLNSIKRGSSTLLNARLVPIIKGFLKAINIAFEVRDIKAPIVIVRSDGSIMSEKFAGFRAVETLLCGPASSVMGGIELTNEKDSLIIDMGGTTTDMAIVKDGIPVKVDDGISIGKWRTFVKGVYIDTFGLGGDSAVRFDGRGHLNIDPTRVIPLSIAAAKWPIINEKLQELINNRRRHTLSLHEFFCLVKDISENPSYTQAERNFCQALKTGPLIFADAAAATGKDIYNFKIERLEKEGIIVRCGLTPTDIMHIKGDFNRYEVKAAELGARFVAASIDVEVNELADMVYDKVKKMLYLNIVRMLLQERYPHFREKGLGEGLEVLISESWNLAKNNELTNKQTSLSFGFRTPAALVGIGAPIHIFLPDVAKALGTKCIIPENAGVANALGAIVGNITATCEIEIKPKYSASGISEYIVYGKDQNSYVSDKEQAIEIALMEAEKAAREEALKRGASGDINITSEVIMDTAEARGKLEIFLGIKVIVCAVGRISL